MAPLSPPACDIEVQTVGRRDEADRTADEEDSTAKCTGSTPNPGRDRSEDRGP